MASPLAWLARLLRPRVSVHGIRPGDELVIATNGLASEDAVAFLNALQQQLPGSRLHLLRGFSSVEVVRQPDGTQGESTANESDPQLAVQQRADQALASGAPTGPQGNVVVLTHLSPGRVVAVSVPPKQQGDSIPDFSHASPVHSLPPDESVADQCRNCGGKDWNTFRTLGDEHPRRFCYDCGSMAGEGA